MKKLITITFALLLSISGFAQNLKEVLKQAKKENKLVFVDCYFTGCIPCAEMDKDVFPNAAVKAEIEKNFLLLKVDIFKDKLGDTLKVQHILNGFPTFLVLNDDGKLISSSSGFKDAGNLLNLFADARTKAAQHQFLSGYATDFDPKNYPAFYVEFCKTRKGITAATLATYSDSLKNFKAVNALLPYLVSRSADEKAIRTIFEDYKSFAALYGEEVLQPVIDYGLTQKLTLQLKNNLNDSAFESFLAGERKYFNEKIWKICLQTLGNKYFLSMKKDTTAYLNFAIKNPVLYQYHFSALYSSMLVKKSLTPDRLQLFCKWADAIITENSSLELIKLAASINQQAKNEVGYKRFIAMANAYARKYQIPMAETTISGSK